MKLISITGKNMVITLASTEKEKEKTYRNYSFSRKINDL